MTARQALSRDLRRAGLAVFPHVNPGDITIRHHWTGEPLVLHSFKHKGYWRHGTSRERDTMIAFAQLLKPGDEVIEVGGHIGYISMWLARLIGPTGRLVVCEPGSNNLPYLRRNLSHVTQATVADVALADTAGERPFMEEEFTGQNNSLRLGDGQFEKTMALNHMSMGTRLRMIRTRTLDALAGDEGMQPALIKIDVEGSELDVLRGSAETLRTHQPAVVVEVAFDHAEVEAILIDAGYRVFNASLTRAESMRDYNLMNYVCLHRDGQAMLLEQIVA